MRILWGNIWSLLESKREHGSSQKEVEIREKSGVHVGGELDHVQVTGM